MLLNYLHRSVFREIIIVLKIKHGVSGWNDRKMYLFQFVWIYYGFNSYINSSLQKKSKLYN